MVDGPQSRRVIVPVADLRDKPDGRRVRQLLFGDLVEVEADFGAHLRIRAHRDGYVGVIRARDLGAPVAATHRVIALATHLYQAPDFRSPDVASLSFGAQLAVTERSGNFCRTHEGYFVPAGHVAGAHLKFRDPAGVAELFLGVPYLWGGNSRLGLDCSGLVQIACLACGAHCPGDSGAQSRELGLPLPDHATLERGDLLFWDGHVAMMVSESRMIHANAHHMSVVFEPVADAVRRIAEQGDGPVTGRRRLDLGR